MTGGHASSMQTGKTPFAQAVGVSTHMFASPPAPPAAAATGPQTQKDWGLLIYDIVQCFNS